MNNCQDKILDSGQVQIPQGIIIQKVNHGHRLIAAKNFSKGDCIFTIPKILHVPPQTDKIKMRIKGVEYICDQSHTIKYDNYRYFGYFSSFMNHNCDANTIFGTNKQKFNNLGIQLDQCYALREIKAGEQITCNYLVFYYDGEDEQWFECCCGSARCYKHIKGFKYLDLEDKIHLLPLLYSEAKQLWLKEDKRITLIENYSTPKRTKLNNNFDQLYAQDDFKEGQQICRYIPMQLQNNSIVIIKKGESYEKIDQKILKQMLPSQFQILKYLTRRSQQPNSKIISQGKQRVLICIKNINKGQQICS